MMREFLEAIWGTTPDGFGEIRSIKDGEVRQAFSPIISASIADAEHASALGRDTYFGVLRRNRMSGKAVDVSAVTPLLWADVDAKKAHPVLSIGKYAALAAINAYPIPPQVIVDSGGGYHAYWLLEEPVAHAQAAPAMKWIADDLKGDHVQDAPRVLRMPGTYNWKREPIKARLLRLDLTRKYRFSDFAAMEPPEAPRRRRPLPTLPARELPDWLVELITNGAPQGQRSEACFRTMIWLLRYGVTPEGIRTIFRNTPNGIGEKYDQKPRWDADRWLDFSLAAAADVA